MVNEGENKFFHTPRPAIQLYSCIGFVINIVATRLHRRNVSSFEILLLLMLLLLKSVKMLRLVSSMDTYFRFQFSIHKRGHFLGKRSEKLEKIERHRKTPKAHEKYYVKYIYHNTTINTMEIVKYKR